ncbi:ABC transporter substrate-binding protein [Microcella humidisoli]|uniref:ABC transporter substrate-binding protein n=1 Tax=Microcella humidisoli TaxID=2963406 RepID=A0ABY5FTW1_9MICO|nr:ABC transporter substrate-binding protein [Microcella humidisoli]UTT61412.1 ABC transporter substrate-binding protein [Microcella humidisoli]
MSRLALVAVGVAAAVVLAGCAAPRPLPTPTPTPSETVGPTGDGVLRIGTLFPMSGDVSFIGPAMVAAVEIAVRDINAAGGVLGEPVEVFYRNSGASSDDRLETAFAELVEREVDVVIGPASSALAERLIPLAEAADVTVISPAATYPTVRSAAPQGVFFRTIPAYDQQATAIVRAVADDGGQSVALITTGDALGFSFELAVRAALEQEGMRLSSIEQLDAATNVDRLAFSVTGGEPDAVILATGTPLAEQNAAVLAALIERGAAPEQLWLTAQNLADYSESVEAGLLEGVSGVLEGADASEQFITRLRQSDPFLRTFRYAPETYDAVVLAALAAAVADDDGGLSIARTLTLAAGDGVPCASFGECIEVLSTEPAIDYEGLSGPLTLDEAGDVVEGDLGLYRYTAENVAERVGVLPIVAR